MAVLKIRDKNGNVIPVPVVTGDNGNLAGALKGTMAGMDAVAMKDVSSLPHVLEITLTPYNLINQESFFSVSYFTLSCEVGKTYTLSYKLKEGADISGVTSGIWDVYDGGATNWNFIVGGEIQELSTSITITIEEGHTYSWYTENANTSDVFESVSMVLESVEDVTLTQYGKNLYNYPGNKGGTETIDIGVIDTPSTLSFSIDKSKRLGTIQLKRKNGDSYVRVAYITMSSGLHTPSFVVDGITNAFGEYQLTFANTSQEGGLATVQRELGLVATAFEPYVEPKMWDGTAFHPSTTLISDTKGVNIAVEYNRDINKAYQELKNAILNLGGTLNV